MARDMEGRLRGANAALLVALAAIWGFAFDFISVGLDRFSPILLAALRYDVSALALLAYALATRRGPMVPRTRTQWAMVAVAGTLSIASYNAFLNWGQRSTTAGVAAVIVGLNPILTTVFSHWLLHDERVGWKGGAGLLLGFVGVALLAVLKPGPLWDARGVGELAVVAAILSWALASVLVRRSRHGMPPLGFSIWHAAWGALVLHLAALAVEGGGRARFDAVGVGAVAYLGIASGGVGLVWYYRLLDRVGPIRVNLVSYIVPVFATAAGFAVLHHPVEPRAVLAFLLVAAGFFLVARHGARLPSTPAGPRAEDASLEAPDGRT